MVIVGWSDININVFWVEKIYQIHFVGAIVRITELNSILKIYVKFT
jgi:hypothetical protein